MIKGHSCFLLDFGSKCIGFGLTSNRIYVFGSDVTESPQDFPMFGEPSS